MIHTNFFRADCETECVGCNTNVEANAPIYRLIMHTSNATVVVNLCEDCGNDLQNNMADDYQRFVDLGE